MGGSGRGRGAATVQVAAEAGLRKTVFRGIRRILVPLDLAESAGPLLDLAMELMRARGAVVRLIHVAELPWLPPLALTFAPVEGAAAVTVEETRADAARRLAEIAATRPALHCECKAAVGDPAREILREAREWDADVVVVGTHGRTGIYRAVLGSVAEQVVRRAPCAVLVVRRGDFADE